jgi:hypothetical protein
VVSSSCPFLEVLDQCPEVREAWLQIKFGRLTLIWCSFSRRKTVQLWTHSKDVALIGICLPLSTFNAGNVIISRALLLPLELAQRFLVSGDVP